MTRQLETLAVGMVRTATASAAPTTAPTAWNAKAPRTVRDLEDVGMVSDNIR